MLTANVGGGRADIRTDVNEVWVTNEITDKTPTNSRNEFLNSPTIRNLCVNLDSLGGSVAVLPFLARGLLLGNAGC